MTRLRFWGVFLGMAVASVPERRTCADHVVNSLGNHVSSCMNATAKKYRTSHISTSPEIIPFFSSVSKVGYSKSSQLVIQYDSVIQHACDPHRSKLHQRGTVHLWHLATAARRCGVSGVSGVSGVMWKAGKLWSFQFPKQMYPSIWWHYWRSSRYMIIWYDSRPEDSWSMKCLSWVSHEIFESLRIFCPQLA